MLLFKENYLNLAVFVIYMNLSNLLETHMERLLRYMAQGGRWQLVSDALEQANRVELEKFAGEQHDLSEAINNIANYTYSPSATLDHLETSRFISQAILGYIALKDYLNSEYADSERILNVLPSARKLSYRLVGEDVFATDFVHTVDDYVEIEADDGPFARLELARLESEETSVDVADIHDYADKLREGMQVHLLTNPKGWARFFNNLVEDIGISHPELYKIKDPTPHVISYLNSVVSKRV